MAGSWTWPWKTRSVFLVPWFVILSSRTLSQRQRKQRNCWQPYVVRIASLVRLGALLLLLASFAADWSAGSGDCVTPFGRPLVCVNISRNLFPRVLSYYSSQRARRTANLALPRVHWTIEDIREGSFDFRSAWKNKNTKHKTKQTNTNAVPVTGIPFGLSGHLPTSHSKSIPAVSISIENAEHWSFNSMVA